MTFDEVSMERSKSFVKALQVLPCKKNGENLRRGRRIRCHWCRKGGASNLIKCSSCKDQFFCLDCIKEQYFSKRDEVQIACPVCCGTCRCKAYSVNQRRETECKRINQDQSVEIDVEAKIQGKKQCDIQVQPTEFGDNKEYCCSKCKTFILDFHRSWICEVAKGCSHSKEEEDP